MAGYLNLPNDFERNYQKRIVDSKGQAGPTLQRIADREKVYKSNTGMLESMFEALAPLGMYSGDAEGAYIPSNAMKRAQGLAKVFQDWYKGGTPTINVPFDKWPDIIKSGKFKNQMELAGKKYPEAWEKRIEVEKELGGIPYPRTMEMRKGLSNEEENQLEFLREMLSEHKDSLKDYYPLGNLTILNSLLKDIRILKQSRDKKRQVPIYSESLAKQNPVYGHIYNPKYTHKGTATGFGNTHAEMSDLVKDQSQYVLGDSFHPLVETAFSSNDMLGNTSRLERALFGRAQWNHDRTLKDPQSAIRYMEMWVPNHLARLNNVKSVYLPEASWSKDIQKSVPVEDVLKKDPNLLNMQKDMNQLYYPKTYSYEPDDAFHL